MRLSGETAWQLGRIARATELTAKRAQATRREVAALRKDVAELVKLAKQGGVLAALYGGGAALHMTSDQAADLLGSLVRQLLGAH
jgi:hypothetical protein